ncbi:MAG: V-type ATP synthase subunit I [Oscillospiraceae bacterium]|jgi:V/A-type H+-transporting ATPase subunit I|nr:V-type ATP synthase subunit I [Oscillospiraceae bacterium]
MAIVKMKRVSLLAMHEDRDALLSELQLIGCVQLTESTPEEGTARLAEPDMRLGALRDRLARAIVTLDRYAPVKTGLFYNRPLVEMADLLDSTLPERVEIELTAIETAESELNLTRSEITKLETERLALIPWTELDVPLHVVDTAAAAIRFGGVPPSVDLDALRAQLAELDGLATIYLAGADRNARYLLTVNHKSVDEQVTAILREFAFNRTYFKDTRGTARENVDELDSRIGALRARVEELLVTLKSFTEYRQSVRLCFDQVTQLVETDSARSRLFGSERVFALSGWVPVPEIANLELILARRLCAYEFTDPEPGDAVPIKLRNNKFTDPLNMVTEMYALPQYGNTDPNPLMSVFYYLFFGLMFNDIGYGLVLVAVSLLVRYKVKRLRGTMRHLMGLMFYCGLATVLSGVLSGSFFGNAIPTVAGFFGYGVKLYKPLIDPMSDPMTVLIGGMALGVVHILFGMGVKAYLLIRDGRALDALFDVGFWWITFAGITLLALGITPWVAIAGAGGLVLTQGREKPTVAGKLVGGLGSLYNITAYASDVLSYSRIMALMMTGTVIANIVNTLGALPGIVGFVPIFIVGHVFNMGLNIIGTYVHDARLQYLEFFGKFYEDGGRAFKPLSIKPKYNDIV